MKKILRQTLALMMATIMAIPAVLVMPFSASAAEETITPSKYVLVTSSTSGDRGDGDDGCIVNDGSADNMSAPARAVPLQRYQVCARSSV